MSVYKGQTLTLSIFGASHGPSIGMTLSGIPSEANINLDVLQEFMARRAPGNSPFSTSRKEPDIPEFVSGLRSESSGNSRNPYYRWIRDKGDNLQQRCKVLRLFKDSEHT